MVHLADVTSAIPAFVFHYQTARPVPWKDIFGGVPRRPLVVEIGCGLGEFLVRSAAARPDEDFVGIEQEWERVKKTLRRIVRVRETGNPINNVRVMQVDAGVAMERLFEPRSISRIHCLFPCPWPKEKHAKYRLFSRAFLRLINSRLAAGGTVEVVTDHQPYFEWVRDQADGCGFKLAATQIAARFDTKFERKWLAEGKQTFYQLVLTKQRHIPSAPIKDIEMKLHFSKQFDPDQFVLPESRGKETIVGKDFLYDAKRRRAMVRVIVAEKSITQHVWISIVLGKRGWCVAKAEGHTVLPTEGVAQAIKEVYRAVVASGKARRASMPAVRVKKIEIS